MTVVTERDYIRHVFDGVEVIEEVADTLGHDDERRAKLLRVAEQTLSDCGPVRVRIAAEMLELSEPTVRTWVREGVLHTTPGKLPRMLLDPRRLHEVMHLVADLRHANRTRGLLDAVWHRLSDQALLERPDLVESIEQMRLGQGREIDPEDLRS